MWRGFLAAVSIYSVLAMAPTGANASSTTPEESSSSGRLQPPSPLDRERGAVSAPTTEPARPSSGASRAGVEAASEASGSWIDTTDRAAVVAAFHDEFGRNDPATRWTGDRATCDPGTVSAELRDAMISRVNWYRAMAGVGGPVVEDASLSERSQAAALSLGSELSYPTADPSTWGCATPESIEGVENSITFWGAEGLESVDWFFNPDGNRDTDDATSSRRWLLEPSQTRMGIGSVPYNGDTVPAAAIWVNEAAESSTESAPVRNTDRIWSWPPEGYVPASALSSWWTVQTDDPEYDFTHADVDLHFLGVEGAGSYTSPSLVVHPDGSGFSFRPLIPKGGEPDMLVEITVSGVRKGDEQYYKRFRTTVIRDTQYEPVNPCRIADTRSYGPIPPNVRVAFDVAGTSAFFGLQGGVDGGCRIPRSASAVVASITAVKPAAQGFARVWPWDERPGKATVVNYSPGRSTTNTFTMPVGSGIYLEAFRGNSDFVIDVQGFYAARPDGASFVPLRPCRVVDTRSSHAKGRLRANEQRSFQVAGSGSAIASQGGRSGGCGVPDDATAVSASVSAVAPTGAFGYLRAWPSGGPVPNATVLNYTGGASTTNTGVIPLGASAPGAIDVRNYAGSTDVVIDVQGYYTVGGGGLAYVVLPSCRMVDTRESGPPSRLGPNEEYGFALHITPDRCQLPQTMPAFEATVTAVAWHNSPSGYARLWPYRDPMPNATFLNYQGRSAASTNSGALTVLPDDFRAALSVRNYGGEADYIIDSTGYYFPAPPGT